MIAGGPQQQEEEEEEVRRRRKAAAFLGSAGAMLVDLDSLLSTPAAPPLPPPHTSTRLPLHTPPAGKERWWRGGRGGPIISFWTFCGSFYFIFWGAVDIDAR